MKKIFLTILIASMLLIISCSNLETGATQSCCDVGCYTDGLCENYPCPTGYHYESDVDKCVHDTGTTYVGQVCFPEGDKLCKKAYWSNGYFYCDILEVVTCDYGCLNGECIGQGVPDCTNGYMICSDGIDVMTPDPNGDVYTCTNGQWTLSEVCESTELCEERTATNAWCKSDLYYCLNNNFNCISCSYREGSFTTLQDCLNEIVYYCLSEDKTICTKRTGDCLSGELSFKGTDDLDVKATCENQICGKENAICCANDECESNLKCLIDNDYQYPDGTPYKICVKPTINNICESTCSESAWIEINGNIILPNYLCIWKCKIASYFRPLIIGVATVLGIIIFLISYARLKDNFKKKNEKWMKWVFSIIFGAIIGLAFYFYIILWVVLIIVYIIIMIILEMRK